MHVEGTTFAELRYYNYNYEHAIDRLSSTCHSSTQLALWPPALDLLVQHVGLSVALLIQNPGVSSKPFLPISSSHEQSSRTLHRQ